MTNVYAATSDHLTTAGRANWREERLGPQILTVNVMGADFGTSPDGQRIAYLGMMGEPERLFAVDAQDGKILNTFDVKGAGGSYGVLVTTSGTVYLPSHPNGNLYRLAQGAQTIENLGVPAAGATFIWQLAEAPDGKIYGACYPKSKLFVLDSASGKSTDLGSMVDGEDYARCLVINSRTGKVYVGIGSHAGLIEYDPATGARRDILPEKYKSEHFVYSLSMVGDRLIARMDPSTTGIVLNTTTGRVESEFPDLSSNAISAPDPVTGEVYYTGSSVLRKVDPATGKVVDLDAHFNAGARGFSWRGSKEDRVLDVALSNGKLLRHDPRTGRTVTISPATKGLPIHLHNAFKGPDGKVYTSGYVVGQLGVFDPQTKSNSQLGGVKQAEGFTSYGTSLYMGTYPHAVISTYDTSAPVKAGNPRELFRLDAEGQDRPFAMLSVPELKTIFIGTVPGYGLLGGALATYSPDKNTTEVHRDLIPHQSIVTLAYKDGLVYGGTSIWGGLGIQPTEKEARLFAWDPRTRKLVFEIVPVKDAQGISSLMCGPDGNLWGWAEGTLFIFNPVTKSVVYSEKKFSADGPVRHYWRGGFMTPVVNDRIYGMLFGNLYELNVKTKATTLLAKGDLELMIRDDGGRLYFVEEDNLLRLVPLEGSNK